jgi:hypothetical protein
MRAESPEQHYRDVMRALECCGFQAVGATTTQGSGLRGRALSADGTVWVGITATRTGLRGLRRFFARGTLRSTEVVLSFTTELNDGSYLVTTTAVRARRAVPGRETVCLPQHLPAAAVAQRHMQRLEAYLRSHSPLKPLIQLGIVEVLAAENRAHGLRPAPGQALTVEMLRQLGVAPHLAWLIAGPAVDTRETLST